MVAPPPTPPCVIIVVKSVPEMFRWPFNIVFLGGGGSILSVLVFGVKYTLFFYKNIFYKTIEAEICEILTIL